MKPWFTDSVVRPRTNVSNTASSVLQRADDRELNGACSDAPVHVVTTDIAHERAACVTKRIIANNTTVKRATEAANQTAPGSAGRNDGARSNAANGSR